MAIVVYLILKFVEYLVKGIVAFIKYCFYEADSVIVWIASYYGFKYLNPTTITDENVWKYFFIIGGIGMVIYKFILTLISKHFKKVAIPLQFILSMFSVFFTMQLILIEVTDIAIKGKEFRTLALVPSNLFINNILNFILILVLAVIVFEFRSERYSLNFSLKEKIKSIYFGSNNLEKSLDKDDFDSDDL